MSMKRMRRILAGLVTILMVCQSVGAAGLLGDVDGDGNVTAKDKMLLSRYVAGWEGYEVKTDTGDIDRDGDVDTEDAALLSQYFAGYAIEGIGEKAIDVTGFALKPEITSGNTLRFTTDVSGTVYYYYLKNDVAPDKEDFIHYWNSGNFGDYTTVQAGISTEIKITYTTHDYITLCVYDGKQYYEPVVLLVDLETGFEKDPYYENEDIQYIAEVPGTLHYYYTTDGTAVSAKQFQMTYDNMAWQYKGYTSINVIDGETNSMPVIESYREEYPYMVIALEYLEGKYYKPVVVNVDVSGFVNVPYLLESDEDVLLNLTTKYDGTVYYYFTNTRVAPDTLDYNEMYETAEYKGSYAVTANERFSIKIADQGTVNDRYVVVQFESAIRRHVPVLLPNEPIDVTGFATKPYMAAADEVSFKPRITGTVYWYVSDSDDGVSADTFMAKYDDADDTQRGQLDVTKNYYASITVDRDISYIVFMLMDNSGNYYQPVIVESIGDGFTIAPYCDSSNKQVVYQTSGRGRVYYYYSIATSAYSETIEEFWKSYSRNVCSSTATTGALDSISFASISTNTYRGMMLLYVDSNNVEYYPVYVDLSLGTGFSSASWSIVEGYPFFTGVAAVDGEVTFSIVNVVGTTSTMSVSKGEVFGYTIDFNICDLDDSETAIDSFTFSAQMKDTDGNIYQAVTLST